MQSRNDCGHWARYVASPSLYAREVLGFPANAIQAEVLDTGANRGILCCSRQWGKTTTVAAKTAHHVVFHPAAFAVVVARCLQQSTELLRRIRAFLVKAGFKLRRDPDIKHSIVLPQGQRIIALAADEHNLRGPSAVTLLIVDEAARVADKIYFAALPFLAATDGQLWLMSTPCGKSGFFYDEWTSSDTGWLRIHSTVEQATHLKRAFIDRQRLSKPLEMFREEYWCEFREPEGQVFPSERVRAAFSAAAEPLPRNRYAHGAQSTEIHYWIGVDLGKRRDHTAIAVLERHTFYVPTDEALQTGTWQRTTLRVRHLERLPLGTDYTDIVCKLRELCSYCAVEDRATLVIDAGGVGQAFVDFLRQSRPRAKIVAVGITGGSAPSYSNGIQHVPKLELLGKLRVWIETGALEIAPALPDSNRLRDELLNLRREISTGGETFEPERDHQHDDLVMALSLACWYPRAPFPMPR